MSRRHDEGEAAEARNRRQDGQGQAERGEKAAEDSDPAALGRGDAMARAGIGPCQRIANQQRPQQHAEQRRDGGGGHKDHEESEGLGHDADEPERCRAIPRA